MNDQTTWRSCRLEPDDVLFFRDGKPSSLGTDHYLHSLFPPHPSTLYGALRTRRLLDGGVELRGLEATTWQQRLGDLTRELGTWGRFGSLELRGPWLVRGLMKDQEEVLLPAPADLAVVVEKEDERVVGEEERRHIAEVVRYRLEDGAAGGWSHHLGLWQPYRRPSDGWEPWPADAARKPRPAAGWYLTPAGFDAWAKGDRPDPKDFVDHRELWTDEVRTGLGLESTSRSSKTGLLYTFGFIRLQSGISLGFEVRGSGLDASGRVRLGGEGRTAELAPGPPPCAVCAGRKPSRRFMRANANA